MPQAPEWTPEQCESALDSPHLSDQALGGQIDRSEGAVQTVRSFLHNYHRGGDISGLSLPMRQAIRKKQGTITCPKCRQVF
jgi:hypothetical protein